MGNPFKIPPREPMVSIEISLRLRDTGYWVDLSKRRPRKYRFSEAKEMAANQIQRACDYFDQMPDMSEWKITFKGGAGE